MLIPQQRLEIYEKIEQILIHSPYPKGLCTSSVDALISSGLSISVAEVLREFPEIWEQKPAQIIGPYWWPLENQDVRKDVMKKAIENVKKLIENGEETIHSEGGGQW